MWEIKKVGNYLVKLLENNCKLYWWYYKLINSLISFKNDWIILVDPFG